MLDILHSPKNESLLAAFPKAIRGQPGCDAPVQNEIDASRAKEMFGWRPIEAEKMVVDMTRSLMERKKEWDANNASGGKTN